MRALTGGRIEVAPLRLVLQGLASFSLNPETGLPSISHMSNNSLAFSNASKSTRKCWLCQYCPLCEPCFSWPVRGRPSGPRRSYELESHVTFALVHVLAFMDTVTIQSLRVIGRNYSRSYGQPCHFNRSLRNQTTSRYKSAR